MPAVLGVWLLAGSLAVGLLLGTLLSDLAHKPKNSLDAIKKAQGEWITPEKHTHNWGYDGLCLICGTPKSER
jgi:hypothetical protein